MLGKRGSIHNFFPLKGCYEEMEVREGNRKLGLRTVVGYLVEGPMTIEGPSWLKLTPGTGLSGKWGLFLVALWVHLTENLSTRYQCDEKKKNRRASVFINKTTNPSLRR